VRWVVTAKGERAHAVFRAHGGKTVCGVGLERVVGFASGQERCPSCLRLWAERGRASRPRAKKPIAYRPQHQFEDWALDDKIRGTRTDTSILDGAPFAADSDDY
jgi:hypothetical protein